MGEQSPTNLGHKCLYSTAICCRSTAKPVRRGVPYSFPPQKPTYRQSVLYTSSLGREGGLFRAPGIQVWVPCIVLEQSVLALCENNGLSHYKKKYQQMVLLLPSGHSSMYQIGNCKRCHVHLVVIGGGTIRLWLPPCATTQVLAVICLVATQLALGRCTSIVSSSVGNMYIVVPLNFTASAEYTVRCVCIFCVLG